LVRGKSMLTCPKCHVGVPEEMRFCLQCGASLAPPAPPAVPRIGAEPPMRAAEPVAPPAPYAAPPPRNASPTVSLKIAATPVMSPRPSLGDEMVEIDDEALKRSFARPVTHPGAVICRFCKGPLDLDGDFCEQCGAPVMEAAPPGMVKPKPQPVEPPVAPVATPPPPPSTPAVAAPPARPHAASVTGQHRLATPPAPATRTEPAYRTQPRTPVPVVPTPRPTPPVEEPPSGLMGRLKGLFKKD